AHRPAGLCTDDRCPAGRAGRDEEEQVRAVAEQEDPEQDASEAPLEQQGHAAGEQDADKHDEGEVDAHSRPPTVSGTAWSSVPCLPSMSRSMPPPKLRRMSSMSPTTTR